VYKVLNAESCSGGGAQQPAAAVSAVAAASQAPCSQPINPSNPQPILNNPIFLLQPDFYTQW
jgi:hypothetical protein